jgi:hypothetical protein
MRRGRSRSGRCGGGGVGVVEDEDWYSNGCCGPDTSWDKNLTCFLIPFHFVTRNSHFRVPRNSAKLPLFRVIPKFVLSLFCETHS